MSDTKKRRGIVFKISHPDVDDKCYIGQTLQSLSARWATLKTNAKKWGENPDESVKLSRLYKAIIDHGPDKMEIVELEEHEHSSKDELVEIIKEREAYFIKANNSLKKGWNSLSKVEVAKRRKDIIRRIEGVVGLIVIIIVMSFFLVFVGTVTLEEAGPIAAAIAVLLALIIIVTGGVVAVKQSGKGGGGGGGGGGFSSCGGCGGGGGGCGGGD